jgi:hypothetical protein
MTEHNGRLIDTREEEQVRRELLDWWKSDCGWGRPEGVSEMETPIMSDQPGIFKKHTTVTPSPSQQRDRPHSNSYGLNSKGRKSHRKPEPVA